MDLSEIRQSIADLDFIKLLRHYENNPKTAEGLYIKSHVIDVHQQKHPDLCKQLAEKFGSEFGGLFCPELNTHLVIRFSPPDVYSLSQYYPELSHALSCLSDFSYHYLLYHFLKKILDMGLRTFIESNPYPHFWAGTTTKTFSRAEFPLSGVWNLEDSQGRTLGEYTKKVLNLFQNLIITGEWDEKERKNLLRGTFPGVASFGSLLREHLYKKRSYKKMFWHVSAVFLFKKLYEKKETYIGGWEYGSGYHLSFDQRKTGIKYAYRDIATVARHFG